VSISDASHTKQAYSLTRYLSRRGLMGWLDTRRRAFWHGAGTQVLEASNRLVGALCMAIRGCDRPDAFGNRC
jgi:hypothetical protein